MGYFSTVYRDYDRRSPAPKLEFYRGLLDRWAPAGGRILDMGCADGRFIRSLGPQWEGYGIDTDAEVLPKGERFAVAGAAAPPFNGSFHALTAFDVAEHVPDLDRLGRYLQELKPGGVCILVVPVYDGPLGGIVRRLDHDPTHVHKQGRQWWLDWMGRYVKVEDWLGIFRYLAGSRYLHWPTQRLRSIAPAIAMIGRNK